MSDAPGSERQPRRWKEGEPCRLRAPEMSEPIDAVVMIASPNGVSLIIAFDALVHGHAGMMALLWQPSDRRNNFEPGYYTPMGNVLIELTND